MILHFSSRRFMSKKWDFTNVITIPHTFQQIFHSKKDPIKILGAHLSYNADKSNDANFFSKIRKMKTKLNLWQTRDLALFGKSILAKTLGASQLIYTASLMTVPYAVTCAAQNLRFYSRFCGKIRKIKLNEMLYASHLKMVALIL